VRRALRVALLLFQALWLNVLLPGHTRGVIVTPGTDASQSARDCCHSNDASGRDVPTDQSRRAAHCAICFFAAHMTLPPVVDFSPPPLGLTDTLVPLTAKSCHLCEFVPTYLGRAPPMA
jgi:hypothetical protein